MIGMPWRGNSLSPTLGGCWGGWTRSPLQLFMLAITFWVRKVYCDNCDVRFLNEDFSLSLSKKTFIFHRFSNGV